MNLLNGTSFNIDWTQGAQVLAALTEEQIEKKCARELCTGKKINTAPMTARKNPDVYPSKAIKWIQPNQPHKSHEVKRKFSKDLSIKLTESQESEETHVFETSSLLKEKKEEKIESNEGLEPFSLPQERISSNASPLSPFYQGFVDSIKPWFSLKAWGTWLDKGSESLAKGIINHARKVRKNAPGYFPGNLPQTNSSLEFYNYPTPHFQAPNENLSLNRKAFDLIQGVVSNESLPHSPTHLALPSGSNSLAQLPN